MKALSEIEYQFVKYIPDDMKNGTLYISIEFATAVHNCCCGCGNSVITPISPTDWELSFDGRSVSLYPSIGNWSFKCESHYWIQHNRVVWGRRWSRREIKSGRALDWLTKERYYKGDELSVGQKEIGDGKISREGNLKTSLFQKLMDRLF